MNLIRSLANNKRVVLSDLQNTFHHVYILCSVDLAGLDSTPVFVQDSVSPANDTHGSDGSLRRNDTEACANRSSEKKVKERVRHAWIF